MNNPREYDHYWNSQILSSEYIFLFINGIVRQFEFKVGYEITVPYVCMRIHSVYKLVYSIL